MTAETVKENAILFGIIEEKKYTPADMDSFVECLVEMTSQWIYDPTNKVWFQKHSTETKTTKQLRELWEVWKLAQQRCNGGCCDNGTGYCMFCEKKLI